MYMYEVWGRPADLHTCAVPELECQSRETPTCYTQSATGSRNQEFVPPLRDSKCAPTTKASLGHYSRLRRTNAPQQLVVAWVWGYTCEIAFHTYFQSTQLQYKHIQYIHLVYQ